MKALCLPPNPDLVVRSRQSRVSRGVASLSFLLILLCGWISAQTPPNLVTLSGSVRDEAGAAVAGARVEASGRSTVSDAAGAYLLVVPPGSTRVEVSQRARMGYSLSLDLIADDRVGWHQGAPVLRAGRRWRPWGADRAVSADRWLSAAEQPHSERAWQWLRRPELRHLLHARRSHGKQRRIQCALRRPLDQPRRDL